MEDPGRSCDIASFYSKIEGSCSYEVCRLWHLSSIGATYPGENLGLLLMKRLGIPDGELKASEWMTVCKAHRRRYLQRFTINECCGECSSLKSLKRVTPRNQDSLGGTLVVGQKICPKCLKNKPLRQSNEDQSMPKGQIWVHLDHSFRIINSFVPTLRLLSRGLFSEEPLLTPPGLSVKDAIEIRYSLDNMNTVQKEYLTDKLVALGIILSYSEFRSCADACIKILRSILSLDGDHKYKKADKFVGLKLRALVFIPDENKSCSSKLEQYVMYKERKGSCHILCLACDKEKCIGCLRTLYPSPISLGDSKGRHIHYLQSTCRVCKSRINVLLHCNAKEPRSCFSNNCKHNYLDAFKDIWNVSVDKEDPRVYPSAVCRVCRTHLSSPASHSELRNTIPSFKPHAKSSFCDCDFKFFYANAHVQETDSALSVVINYSPIPSLGYLSMLSLASTSSNGTHPLTVKIALEIYQTFMHVYNKKSYDCLEYFKNLVLKKVLLSPIKLTLHHKANAFQSVLTLLCDASSHASKENRLKYRRKVDTVLNADFHGTEPFLRSNKKIIKFRVNYSVFSMCVICSDLLCNGSCSRNSSNKASKRNSLNQSSGRKKLQPKSSINKKLSTNPEIKRNMLEVESDNKTSENLSLSSSESSPGPSRPNKSTTPPKEFFSHCPDCQFHFRREHIYLKHLETCYPGIASLICSTCSRTFSSEMGMLKHSCEGISSLENHQYKNIALNLDPLDYPSFMELLLSSTLPKPWRSLPGPKDGTLLIQKEGSPFQFKISRYKHFTNKARLKGEGVKAFKSEVWATLCQFAEREDEESIELMCSGCHLDDFTTLIELDEHQIDCEEYQNGGSYFECDGCDKTFSSEGNYISHIKNCELIEIPADVRSFYPDESGRIFCPGCSSVFIEDEVEYFHHLKMCHFVKFDNFPCRRCGSKYSTWKTLEIHKCVVQREKVPTATITSSSSSSTSPSDSQLPKRIKLNNSFYEPICKAGNYTCPLCRLHFTLNQPYGNHVKNTECVSSNIVVDAYSHQPGGMMFATLVLSSNSENNNASSIMKVKYGRVPSLRLLCRGFGQPSKPISSPPPLTVQDAIEIYQGVKKSIATQKLDKGRLWEWIRASIYPSFGDFDFFEALVSQRRRVLSSLICGLKFYSGSSFANSSWHSKIKTYISTPFHDQFMEEGGLLSRGKGSSFKVLEYPSDQGPMVRLLCLRCNDILCIGCEGEYASTGYSSHSS